MKKILFILLISTSVFSQKLEKTVKEFKMISISSSMDIELIESTFFKVTATGNDVEKLIIENKGQELKIGTKIGKKFNSDIKLKIYYKPGIRYIKASNNVNLHSDNIIKESFLELVTFNNVTVNLNMIVKDFQAKIELGSVVNLKGSTESQNLKVLSKSEFHGFDFKSEKTYVKAITSKADVFATNYLEANARVKAEIKYKGKTSKVNEKSFLSEIINLN